MQMYHFFQQRNSFINNCFKIKKKKKEAKCHLKCNSQDRKEEEMSSLKNGDYLMIINPV